MLEKLKKEIALRNITRNKLAIMSNIVPSDLYAALLGRKPFYPGWKKRIAEALDMSVEELFPDEEGVK